MMSASAELTHDALLRLCADADPAPWYPSEYARATGTDRDSLDEPLTHLRLAGLVRLTDWEPGRGQGYALTAAGRAALDSPRALARLRSGDLPAAPAAPAPQRRATTAWERGEAVREALLGSGGAPVTSLLIAAQVFVFVAGMYFALQRQVPIDQYLATGTSPVQRRLLVAPGPVAAGEWWRLVTYAFVHGGLMHLVLNVVGHVALGPVVERMLGPVRMLALWLLSALGGGCAVVLANELAVGSSGALCGMLGAIAAFVAIHRRHLGRELVAMLSRWLSTAVITTVLISLVPGVSWSGHLGGGVAGLLAGALLNYQRFGTTFQRWGAVLGLVLLTVLIAAAAYRAPAVVRQRAILFPDRLDEIPDAERQAIRNKVLAEQKVKLREDTDFEQRVAPEVNQVLVDTDRVCFWHAQSLIGQEAHVRDADQVRAVLAKLALLADEQEVVLRTVTSTGPYVNRPLEEARHAAAGLLDEVSRLGAVCQHYLQARAADDPQRLAAFRRFQEAARRWQAAEEAVRRWRSPFTAPQVTRPGR
jgi:rhomboid protease GluP